MGNLLLYSDIEKAVKDILKHPDAVTIADFISLWHYQYQDLFGATFLFNLQNIIRINDGGYYVTEDEVALVDNLNLNDYSHAPNSKIRFAASYVEYLIGADWGFSYVGSTESFEKPSVRKPNTLSIQLKSVYRQRLRDVIVNLNSVVNFLADETQTETFLDVFCSPNLLDESFKQVRIEFGCNAQIASYILQRIQRDFRCKLPGRVFNETGIFITYATGVPLKQTHFSKSKGEARDTNFEEKVQIDAAFKQWAPYSAY
jgi:hypothetical protein